MTKYGVVITGALALLLAVKMQSVVLLAVGVFIIAFPVGQAAVGRFLSSRPAVTGMVLISNLTVLFGPVVAGLLVELMKLLFG